MTNEEFQTLVLEQLTGLNTRMDGMEREIAGMKQNMSGIEQDIAGIKQDMVTKSDMAENTAILRALENRTDIISAEIDGLKLETVSKAAFERMETKIDILSHRISAQDGEIRLLNLAR